MLRRSLYLMMVGVILLTLWLGSASRLWLAQEGTKEPTAEMDENAVKVQDTMKGHKKTFVPVHAPQAMSKGLDNALKALKVSGSSNSIFDENRATLYITYDPKGGPGTLKEIVVPLKKSSKDVLDKPDARTKVNGTLDAKVIGGVFIPEFAVGPVILVYMTDGSKPPLRFYDGNGQPTEKFPGEGEADIRTYTGGVLPDNTPEPTKSGQSEPRLAKLVQTAATAGQTVPVDNGATISARETCFPVGLSQVCYLYQLQDPNVKTILDAAVPNLSGVLSMFYHISPATGVFDTANGVPDLMGDQPRKDCSKALQSWSLSTTPPKECRATTVFTGLTAAQPTQTPYRRLLALFVVVSQNPLTIDTDTIVNGAVYDQNGVQKPGGLPKGEYVMSDMHPDIPIGSSTPVPLELRPATGPVCFIRGWRIEGIATVGSGGDIVRLQAYLMDSCTDGVCWP